MIDTIRHPIAKACGAALTLAGAFAFALPAAAQDGVHYRAELVEPTSDRTIVAKGTAWVCNETICVARQSTSRPSRVCKGLAREVGALRSFAITGDAMAEDELARCND
jgi:hypothetical protein